VTISDLCTACGTRLDPFFLKGETSLLSSTTNWITTNQQRPGEPAWKTWRRAMCIWSRDDGTLYRPLGAWLYPGDTLRRTWPFYKDLQYPFLYIRTPQGFLQYEDDDNGRYSHGVNTTWLPSTQSIPVHADAILLKDAWMITKLPLLLPPDCPITFASTFDEYLEMLPEWDRTLFDGLVLVESCYEILERLKNALELANDNGEAPYTLFVSNGSAGDGSMSFRWVLCMQNDITLAQCSGPAPGHESSFRSKGYGMLSAVRFLHHLFEYCQDNFVGPYRFVTDNQGLITRV
jgi:hypothetical protein